MVPEVSDKDAQQDDGVFTAIVHFSDHTHNFHQLVLIMNSSQSDVSAVVAQRVSAGNIVFTFDETLSAALVVQGGLEQSLALLQKAPLKHTMI